ncbi:hypothetical protein [Lacticaseibacillus sp. N501-2]|uniref:hypothetical protein n=1 Tax=Lacticaseibacillus salsurae TaxID=3367729 RepID=UPI0038B26512
MMGVNELRVWAECNDGHTTLAGMNADKFTIDEICKWAGVIPLTFINNAEADK